MTLKADIDRLDGTIQDIYQQNSDNQKNTNHLNETIQTIQYDIDNYIALNDVTLKANINKLNGTMQNIYSDYQQNTYQLNKTIQKGVANPAIN